MGYKVRTSDKKDKPCTWKADSEALIALLCVSLEKNRGIDKFKLCRELNGILLKKTNSKNFNPTRLQRAIINKEGY